MPYFFFGSLILSGSDRGTGQQSGTVSAPNIHAQIPRLHHAYFAKATGDQTYISSGLTKVVKWAGKPQQAETVGILAPTFAPTLGTSGLGTITGTYTAYLRFVDGFGNVSDLSPIATSITLVNAGTITFTNVQVPTEPKVARRQILRNTTGQANVYYVDIDTTDITSSSFSTTKTDTVLAQQEEVTVLDSDGVNVANVYAPPRDDKPILALHRDRMFAAGEVAYSDGCCQLTSGRADVTGIGTDWKSTFANRFFYVVGHTNSYEIALAIENDTTKLISAATNATPIVCTSTDHKLVTGTRIVITGGTGNTAVNGTWVIIKLTDNTFSLTGSVGNGTYNANTATWLAPGQTLILTTPYTGATDKFGIYTVRQPPAERLTIYYSEAGSTEAWPALNGLAIQDTGEDINALIDTRSFLFVATRRRLYRLTFRANPATDGGIFLAANRGCVNQRCWVLANGVTYILDERGIYQFGGSDQIQEASEPIRDIFALDRRGDELRVAWEASRYFHACHDPANATIRWFVSLSSFYLPQHALCYNYSIQQWWVEEYPFPVGASVIWDQIKPRVMLGSLGTRVMTMGYGNLDGPDPIGGRVRGTVTSATWTSITDSGATYASSGLVGYPVAIVAGTGKGQMRLVASVSSTTINVVQPWLVKPDTTSVYQLGAVRYQWKSGWFRYPASDGAGFRRLEAIFQPCLAPATLDLRRYHDHALEPEDWGLTWPPTDAESDGWETTEDDPNAVVDLEQERGFVQLRMDKARGTRVNKGEFVAVEMKGHSTSKPISIYQIGLDGAAQ